MPSEWNGGDMDVEAASYGVAPSSTPGSDCFLTGENRPTSPRKRWNCATPVRVPLGTSAAKGMAGRRDQHEPPRKGDRMTARTPLTPSRDEAESPVLGGEGRRPEA